MSNFITPEERQEWISKYKIGHEKIDKVCAAMDFLSRIAVADSDRKLELDTEHRIGLAALFSILSDQLSDSLYDRLPYPDDLAELCKSHGGQADD